MQYIRHEPGICKKPLNFRDEGLAVEKAGGSPGPRKLKGSRQAGMDSSPLLPPFFLSNDHNF